jgi:phage tail sheath protein FI
MSGSIPLITGSPGVYIREEDLSQQVIPVTTGIGALVFASDQGSLSPQLITSATSFTKRYGKSDLSVGFGQIEGLAFLASGVNPNNPNPTALWCLRVVNDDAKFAGADIMNTESGAIGNTGAEGLGLINPWPVGTTNDYTGNGRDIFLLTFTEPLASAASLSGTFTPGGGSPVDWGPVVYATSPAATLAAIVIAINTALAGIPGGTANESAGVCELLLGNPTLNSILIYGMEGNTLAVTAVLTGQMGNAATVESTNELITVTMQNPGIWGNNVGLNITNISTGVLQRSLITFSDALITANDINLSFLVNNTIISVPQVVFTTNNDDTVTAVAAAIQTAISGSTVAAIIPVGSTGTSARQITIVSPNAGPGVVQLYSGAVTNGASQAGIIFNETYAGQVPSNTFTLNVWQRGNITTAAESFNCSLQQQLDGFGNQLFVEDVVNTSAYKSQLITVAVNAAAIAGGAGIDPAFADSFATIVWLNGGDNGSLPTDSQIIEAWNTFTDTETYRVNLLINNGYTDVPVQQNLDLLAQNRQDCMAIIDLPSAQQNVDDAVNYRNTVMDIDSSYSATYTSDVLILDTDNDQQVYVPPSGFVAARYVYTDNNFATWWAPAGLDRGLLPTVLGTRVTYTKPDRDLLDAAQLNALRAAKNGAGIVIWGDKTMQVTPSLLSAVNVRRLMIFIENTIAASLEGNLFDQNSATLAFLVTQKINAFLNPIVGGGILRYLTLANASNNPGYFGDAGQFNVSVYIVPIRAVRTILLDAIVTPSTISFNELIINGVF